MKSNEKLFEKRIPLRRKILNVLYPTDIKCIFCGDELSEKTAGCTCEKCLANLPFIDDKSICQFCGVPVQSLAPICDACHSQKPSFKFARAPFEYTGNIKFIINRFKYNNEKHLAKPLSFFMAETYLENDFNSDFIIFVPLTKEKLKKRGYNQAELIANELSERINLEVKKDIILKVKNTLTQTKLTQSERKINLENAFEISNKRLVKNKSILLIDDVFTTGTTSEHISELLMKAGAKETNVLTLAHTNFYRKKLINNKNYLINFI